MPNGWTGRASNEFVGSVDPKHYGKKKLSNLCEVSLYRILKAAISACAAVLDTEALLAGAR